MSSPTPTERVVPGADPTGRSYWSVVETVYPDRTYYDVLHDGWLVAEVSNEPGGWYRISGPRERVPACVLSELPGEAQALIGGPDGHTA